MVRSGASSFDVNLFCVHEACDASRCVCISCDEAVHDGQVSLDQSETAAGFQVVIYGAGPHTTEELKL